jgi:hypothetical protein
MSPEDIAALTAGCCTRTKAADSGCRMCVERYAALDRAIAAAAEVERLREDLATAEGDATRVRAVAAEMRHEDEAAELQLRAHIQRLRERVLDANRREHALRRLVRIADSLADAVVARHEAATERCLRAYSEARGR